MKNLSSLTIDQSQVTERFYSKLVNSLGGIVWEADGETFQFTFVSPQAEQILGYPIASGWSQIFGSTRLTRKIEIGLLPFVQMRRDITKTTNSNIE